MRSLPILVLLSLISLGMAEEQIVTEWTLPPNEIAEIKMGGRQPVNKPLDPGPQVLIVRSGQKAKLELIREARYPSEFDPAQVVDLAAAARGDGGIVPQTPKCFETTCAGWEISFEALAGPKLITVVGKATYTSV